MLVTELDAKDAGILAEREAELNAVDEPRCGDYVRFPNGELQRVSHVYPESWGEMAGVQTSEGGSWYLGNGYVSFSGGLNPTVKMEALALTDETMLGSCWFFHHDYWTAGGGVDTEIPFRVYESSIEQP